MFDYEAAEQELERQGEHGKEVEGDDHLTMVSNEREPAFDSIAASPHERGSARLMIGSLNENASHGVRACPSQSPQ